MPQGKGWQWDEASRRYRNLDSGRYIGAREMVQLRDAFIDIQKTKTIDLAEKLSDGRITVNDWVLEMRGVVKQTYIDEYVLAKGGRGMMTQSDWGRIGAMTKGQYQYLNAFGQDVTMGRLTDQEGLLRVSQVANRSQMYIDSATSSYERGKMQVEMDNNDEERWVLDPMAEHCQTDGDLIGCTELADMGWCLIGDDAFNGRVPGDGRTKCNVGFKCHKEYRKGEIING